MVKMKFSLGLSFSVAVAVISTLSIFVDAVALPSTPVKLTNAERFRRGLPPNAPRGYVLEKGRYLPEFIDGTRTAKREATASNLPTSSYTGPLYLYTSGTNTKLTTQDGSNTYTNYVDSSQRRYGGKDNSPPSYTATLVSGSTTSYTLTFDGLNCGINPTGNNQLTCKSGQTATPFTISNNAAGVPVLSYSNSNIFNADDPSSGSSTKSIGPGVGNKNGVPTFQIGFSS